VEILTTECSETPSATLKAAIENDPFSYGDVIAEYVLKLLAGRKAAPPKIYWRFISGASL